MAQEQCDLTAAMDGASLKKLVAQHHLVSLRGFDAVEMHALVDYANTIGSLLEWEFGAVMEMRAHAEPKNYLFTHGHVPFHWDGAFHKVPRYLLFHCVEAPVKDSGGETIFSNTSQIWKNATAKEKSAWQQYSLTYKTEKLAHYGGSITQKLVQQHPDSGETILRFAIAWCLQTC